MLEAQGRSSLVLIRGARQLLTLNGPSGPRRGEGLQQLGVIEDGAVLIENGAIVAVGPTRRVENLSVAKGASEINASGRVVMPGFVDSSAHLVTTPRRIFDRPGRSESRTYRALKTTPARPLLFQGSKFMRFCARHGTTTIESKSGPVADEPTQTKLLRIFHDLHMHPLPLVPTFEAGSYVLDAAEIGTNSLALWHTTHLLPRIAARKLARIVQAAIGTPAFDPVELRQFLHAASSLGLRVKVEYAGAGVENAARQALDVAAVALEGIVTCTVEEAQILAQLPSTTIISPFCLATAENTIRRLIDESVAVALASCFHDESQPMFNMQMVVALACRQFGLTAEEAISASTVNGACAIGEARRAGSLQFGKDGDLIILNVSDYHDIPYYYGANLVHMTIRRGEVIFQEDEPLARSAD